MKNIVLSIIIPTIGRKSELLDLFKSLVTSIENISYEIIIIDQNPKGFLDDILNEYRDALNISHHNVDFKGLSKAKNYGAKLAKGLYLSFPDDDCKIFPDTYSKALETVESKKVDIVFGRCIDSNGNDSVLSFKKEPYILNKNNMLGGFVEATGIINKSVFKQGFLFDENMGAGCFHGAEEGYDWLYRILTKSKLKAIYNPEILFYHPQVLLDKGSQQALKRVFTYSCGTGYLCKKHKFYSRYFKRLALVIGSIPVYLVFNRRKMRYYFVEFLGLLSGYILAK
jgi:glycosyltransferase involved in cell wall biosynthesis